MERQTRQRAAILNALEQTGRPLSPQEILSAARKHHRSMGIATVYRALRDLEKEHMIQSVALPGEAARYEMAGKAHHHHFQCRRCSRVFEIEGCPGNMRHLLPKGFVLDSHELLLFGNCADCAAR